MTQKEDIPQNYTIKCLRMNYGLIYLEIRQFVSDYGKKLDCCPQKWQEVGMAGFEWVTCFM